MPSASSSATRTMASVQSRCVRATRSPISHNSGRSAPLTWPWQQPSPSTKYAASSGSRPVSDLEVRPITDDDLRGYLRCVGTAFHNGADVTDEHVDFARSFMD